MLLFRQQPLAIAPVLVVGLGCALRLIWLEADPDYYIWVGYITDEGRWIENARELFFRDELFLPHTNIHLFLAPLFQAVNYLIFQFLDLNRFSARIFPALCGVAILVLYWRSLNGVVSSYALVLGLALLAVQEDLVMLSRLCVPEMPAMLAALGAFVALIQARDRLRYVFLAGILAAACVGLKATISPLLLIFGGIAYFFGSPHSGMRLRRLCIFLLPALAGLGVAVVVILLVAAGYSSWSIASLGDPVRSLMVVASFVGLNSAYGFISFPFENAMAPVVNLWLLGAWLGALVNLVLPGQIEASARRWFAASATWAIGHALVMQSLSYFPDRYKAYLLLPLAIMAAVGLHNFFRVGLKGVSVAVTELTSRRRIFVYCLLMFPGAVLLAPVFLSISGYLGVPADSLRWKVITIGVGWMMLVGAAGRCSVRGWVEMAVLVPLAAFLFWFVGHRSLSWSFWPEAGQSSPLIWMTTVGLAVVFVGLTSRLKAGRDRPGHIMLATAVAYMAISVAPYGQSLFWPRFTLRDVSRELGILLADYEGVANCRVDGLFVDNDLKHLSLYRVNLRDSLPPILVLLRLKPDSCQAQLRNVLKSKYRHLKSYELYVSSRFASRSPRVTVHTLVEESNTARP